MYAHPDPKSFCHAVLEQFTAGGAVGRRVASRDKSTQEVARFIREHAPKDAREQCQKVVAADGLAFVARVFWLRFPAILKGWHHDNAVVITPTLFYEADWEQPMTRIIDDWRLRYPGVKHVEHVSFYGAAIAAPPQIEEYLRHARPLGREFAVPAPAPARSTGA